MDYKRRRRYSDRYRERRSRSRSPCNSKKKRRRSSSPGLKKIEEYKHELARFLEEQASISKLEDFWTFYAKYQAVQALKKSSESDRSKTLNINFIENSTILYDKLPVLDGNGEKVRISLEDFKYFLLSIRVYQDFQQKTTFSKLKKLKVAQDDLPITKYKEEIVNRLRDCRVMLIAGDTGCGKSTQVPQYIMEAGYDKIVCTQPRRIACVSLAKRVAYETLTDYKNTVGYQIRFEKTKRADTKIIFMTEGLLLRQASEQETLNSYDVVILDEVHERHLHGDFIIGKWFFFIDDEFLILVFCSAIILDIEIKNK